MTVILTGAINSGKTTLLSGLAAALRSAGGRPRGLLTLKRFDGERRVYTALDLATGRRRKLLDYLKSKDADRYTALIAKLGLRK